MDRPVPHDRGGSSTGAQKRGWVTVSGASRFSLDSATTALTVGATRLGCNSDETGTVNDPNLEMTDTQVVITFTVIPGEPSSADCQGNCAVSYDVKLPEALGERELVDGGCASTDATSPAPCEPTGVRHAPRFRTVMVTRPETPLRTSVPVAPFQ